MRQKQRVLSIIMSCALIIGMMPYAAWADEGSSLETATTANGQEHSIDPERQSAADNASSSASKSNHSKDGTQLEGQGDKTVTTDTSADKRSDLLTNDAAKECNLSAPYVEDEIIIVYRSTGDLDSSEDVTSERMLDESKIDLDESGTIDAAETTAALDLVDLQVAEQVSDSATGSGIAVVAKIEDGKSVEDAIDDASTVPGVAYVQPNYIYQALGDVTPVNVDDPDSSKQYYLEKAGFLTSWNTAKVNNQVTVAVLDTGCRLDHEDLQGNLLISLAYDTYNDTYLAESNVANNGDASGHGTAVAGIIAAQANNGIGIAGVSYNASILPIKVFDNSASSPSATTVDVIEGLDYVSEIAMSGEAPNLRVVNMSFGFYGSSGTDQSLQLAISSLNEKGILCVCAGGNEANGASVYPADYSDAFAVGSVNQDGGYSDWSNLESKDLAAFGESVLTTGASSSNAYVTMDGSSASAAMVSGAAAILIAISDASSGQIADALRSGATVVDGGPGILNTQGSLEALGVSLESQGAEGDVDSSSQQDVDKELNDTSDSDEPDQSLNEQGSADESPIDEGPSSLFSEDAEKQQGPESSWRYVNGIPLNSFSPFSKWPSEAKGRGIDVSQWQGTINWEKVKASGIKFAIIRCGYGNNSVSQDDPYFKRNVSECERLGIPYGVYIYSYATNTSMASSEADHVIRLLKGHNPTYPVYIDIEDDSARGSDLNAIAQTFCSKVSSAGYRPGVYANLSWWNSYLTSPNLDKYEKWIAQWNESCDYTKPFSMWQYTSSGSVNGISGSVDMNYEFSSSPSSTATTSGTRWQKTGGKWYLINSDGTKLTGWQMSGGDWYLLGSDGAMLTGWQMSGGDWYLLDSDGVMLTGWRMSGDDWYLLDSDGAMLTGWQRSDGKWYLLDSDGAMLTGWQKTGGKWYLMSSSGAMLTGWQKTGGVWYLLSSSGAMLTGWQKVGGKWYLMSSSGAMLTGWQKTGGTWYYLNSDGAWVG